MVEVLSVEGLSIKYPGNSHGNAVTNVSFSVKESETLGLVGESGSGKSTIAKAVIGLVAAFEGKVQVLGKDVTNPSGKILKQLRDNVQLVFQDPYSSLNSRITVGETVAESLQVGKSVTRREVNKEILKYFEMVGLKAEFVNRFPHQLSGGQLQRIAIARALVRRPRLLLLDEVTASLDVSVQAKVLNLLKELQRDLGFATVYISHDLAVVKYLCQSLVVLRNGSVVESGDVSDIYSNPQDLYTRELLQAVPQLGGQRWR